MRIVYQRKEIRLGIVLIRKILFYEKFDFDHIVERRDKWYDNLQLKCVGGLAHLHKKYGYAPSNNV